MNVSISRWIETIYGIERSDFDVVGIAVADKLIIGVLDIWRSLFGLEVRGPSLRRSSSVDETLDGSLFLPSGTLIPCLCSHPHCLDVHSCVDDECSGLLIPIFEWSISFVVDGRAILVLAVRCKGERGVMGYRTAMDSPLAAAIFVDSIGSVEGYTRLHQLTLNSGQFATSKRSQP